MLTLLRRGTYCCVERYNNNNNIRYLYSASSLKQLKALVLSWALLCMSHQIKKSQSSVAKASESFRKSWWKVNSVLIVASRSLLYVDCHNKQQTSFSNKDNSASEMQETLLRTIRYRFCNYQSCWEAGLHRYDFKAAQNSGDNENDVLLVKRVIRMRNHRLLMIIENISGDEYGSRGGGDIIYYLFYLVSFIQNRNNSSNIRYIFKKIKKIYLQLMLQRQCGTICTKLIWQSISAF